MIKKKLVTLSLAALTILMFLLSKNYVMSQERRSLYSDFTKIYQLQKEISMLHILVAKLHNDPTRHRSVNDQWQRLMRSITESIAKLNPAIWQKLISHSDDFQSVKKALREINNDFNTLQKQITGSLGQPAGALDPVIIAKLFFEIEALSSHIEPRSKKIISSLSTHIETEEMWMLILVAFNMLIITFICWNIYKLLLKPVENLLITIDRFGRRSLSVRSHITQDDEIGQLATSFNAMASEIEHSFARENRLNISLRKHRDKLIEANRLAKIGHWELNLDTKTYECSEEIYELFGLSPSQATKPHHIRKSFPKNCWEKLINAIDTCQREGAPFEVQSYIVRPDDTYRYIAIRGNTTAHAGQAATSLHGTVQDITEHHQREEALALSEEKYRLAMRAARDGIWDWDLRTNLIDFSSDWMATLDVGSSTTTYDKWMSSIHPEDKTGVATSIAQHLAGHSDAWQHEYRLYNQGGSWLWVLARGEVVLRDHDDKPMRMVGTLTDISEMKAQEQIIWRQANYDSLTALPNRKLFHEHLQKCIGNAKRNNTQVWLLFLDLDGFKEVNDNLGHDVGDKLLIETAKRLKDSLRHTDIIARLGGDEFVIIISDIHADFSVDKVANHIIQILSKRYLIAQNELHVTTSIGIANYPRDAEDAKKLIQYADQSMYAAKNEGKNRFSYFTESMQRESQFRIELSKMMRKAIIHDDFELFYQPIVDLENGDIRKAESLIRWHHPDLGTLQPEEFIPVAEETGLICDAGLWALQQTAVQLQKWMTLDPHFQISVNMSPLQLKSKDLRYQELLDSASTKGIFKNKLIIEITENLILDDKERVNNKLLKFRKSGIQVAIDDFGTGYSSLAYLKYLDVDYLKIDQSFVRQLKQGNTEETLCKAIITMAHSLGIKVIAEGVENHHQLSTLKSLNCDYAQGFYCCEPLPAKAFEEHVFALVE